MGILTLYAGIRMSIPPFGKKALWIAGIVVLPVVLLFAHLEFGILGDPSQNPGPNKILLLAYLFGPSLVLTALYPAPWKVKIMWMGMIALLGVPGLILAFIYLANFIGAFN